MLDDFLCSNDGVAVVEKAFKVPIIVGFALSNFDKEGKLENPFMAICGTEDSSRHDRILNRMVHTTCNITCDGQDPKQDNIPAMVFSFSGYSKDEKGVVIVTIEALDSAITLSDEQCNGIDDFINEFTEELNGYVEVKTVSGFLY